VRGLLPRIVGAVQCRASSALDDVPGADAGNIVSVGRALSMAIPIVHHSPPLWAVLIPCALLLSSTLFAMWVVIRLSRGWRFGGDDSAEGGGGGGPGPRRPDSPEPTPDGEPEWWDRFEQAFAEYVARSRPEARPTVKASGTTSYGARVRLSTRARALDAGWRPLEQSSHEPAHFSTARALRLTAELR
jgi:hypothetical protein